VTYRRGRWAALLALSAILASPVWVSRAESACTDGQAPAFVAGFASLHEHLGAVMGEPLDCERTELRSGNAQQQTTTGIAVYQRDTNALEFTNGREFWLLDEKGLEHWAGWHGWAGPPDRGPVHPAEQEQLTVMSAATYSKAEAATIMQSLDGDGHRLVLDHAGTPYLVETGGACVDGQPLEGRRVFVISGDAFAAPNSRLILKIAGRDCVITASHPL
jgi:hypothetical protein